MGCVAYGRMNVPYPELRPTGDAVVIIVNRNTHPIDYYLPYELKDITPLASSEKVDERTVKIPPLKAAILGRGKWTKSIEYME